MKKLDDGIREIYEVLETLNEGKKEKFNIFSKDEDIVVEELEKLKFSYFKKDSLHVCYMKRKTLFQNKILR